MAQFANRPWHLLDAPIITGIAKGEADALRTTHVHNTDSDQYAMRHGDWLLIDAKNGYRSRGYQAWEKKRNYPPDDKQPVELYNLANDIGQRNNVAADHPEIVEELQTFLKQIREQGHSAPRLRKK